MIRYGVLTPVRRIRGLVQTSVTLFGPVFVGLLMAIRGEVFQLSSCRRQLPYFLGHRRVCFMCFDYCMGMFRFGREVGLHFGLNDAYFQSRLFLVADKLRIF